MGKIWWSEMELFNRLLQLHRKDQASVAVEKAKRLEETAALEARVKELEQEVAALKASPAARLATLGQ